MTRFIIAGIRRSGTTLIRTTLDAHPQIRCYGEVFSPLHHNEFGYGRFLHESMMRRIQNLFMRRKLVESYLDTILNSPDHRATGFKLILSQSRRYPMVLPYLRRHNTRVIHIVRENVLKTLVSRTTKRVTNVASSTKPVARAPVTLPAEKLPAQLERLRRSNEAWKKETHGMPYLRVTYEDFVAERERELGRMLEFLEVDNLPDVKSSMVKVNPDDMREIIANYDAVERSLKGTPFEWCLKG
jgi:Sulfotransferase family